MRGRISQSTGRSLSIFLRKIARSEQSDVWLSQGPVPHCEFSLGYVVA